MTQRDMSNDMDNNNRSDFKEAIENNTNGLDSKKDSNAEALGERTRKKITQIALILAGLSTLPSLFYCPGW